MIINKQFAHDSLALDDRMDQLLEVLVQLLAEPTPPAADDPGVPDLHWASTRATHVSVNNLKQHTELGSCQ
jgi:hypothetical protein